MPELDRQICLRRQRATSSSLLREHGMLLGEQNYQHSYPYCWRSKTPIIFRAVEQFFIRIDELRAQALEAIQESEMDSRLGRESHRAERWNRGRTG